MQRIHIPDNDLPLHGVPRTRAIEEAAQASLPPHTLMRRAGLAVARLALALAPHAGRIWIAAGPGNNGGDGLEAATHLLRAGKAVHVTLDGDPARLPGDARDAHARALAEGVQIDAVARDDFVPEFAIDALLGIGAKGPPRDDMVRLVARLNALPCPVLAVDAPSGLSAATGQPFGPHCVQADHTLSLLTLKPGLFTARGRDLAGSIWFDDLGTADALATGPIDVDAWLGGVQAARSAIPPRRHAQHKGSFGDVAVIGGAPGMVGAAVLAARAALAAGAGRVHVQLLDPGGPVHDVLRPELMFRPNWCEQPPPALQAATVVCGCGGGEAVRAVLPRLLGRAGRLVLDADALNALAADAALRALLQARAAADRPTILTPHPLEAARLLASRSDDVQADRLVAAQRLAETFHCVVLLKGSGSIIAAPGQAPRINATGNASLAGPGTGDVLAGLIGGLWSQAAGANAALADASAAAIQDLGFAIARAAAHRHGAQADPEGQRPVPASEIVERLANSRR